MLALQEEKKYCTKEYVWIGKYENLENIPHWHDEYEIGYVEKGTAYLYCKGKEFKLSEGMAFLVNSREGHNIRTVENSILAFIMIKKDLVDSIMEKYRVANPVLSNGYGILGVYDRIKHEMTSKNDFYAQAVKAEITNLIVDILRHEKVMKLVAEDESINYFTGLMHEVEVNYADFTFEKAADYVGLNKTYFSTLFHKFANITFTQYLNRVKISNAVKMLSDENRKVTDIAMSCGFDTVRTFNRIFKEITGFSPTQLPVGYTFPEVTVLISDKSHDSVRKNSVLLESSDQYLA